MNAVQARGHGLIDPEVLRQDDQRIAIFPFRLALNDVELHARLGQQLDPTIVHLVARGIAASQQRRLGDRHGLFQVGLDPFDVLVGLSDDVVDRRLEPAVGRHLVADVASRALRYIGGDFRVHLRRRFQAAEVGPEVLETSPYSHGSGIPKPRA